MKIATRLENLPTYIFATLGKRIAELRAAGVDVIRLDIGSPDMPPPEPVIAVLNEAARQPENHGYAGFYGDPEFRRAVAHFYQRRFGVELDPESEVLALIGSKEGIQHLPTAFLDRGSVVLVPNPGYPTYSNPAMLVGAELYQMPLLRENEFLPDFDSIPAEVLRKARVLWLNYPNNPTSAIAELDFLVEAVAFARQHDLLLAYDNPYSEVIWDGSQPPSILQVPGAKDVAIEFNSLSKLANMAGWRVGMVVGNAEAISAIARVKTNSDTGIFRPIQRAAAVALDLPAAWYTERNAVYQRRREIITRALDRMNLWYAPYEATLYVWAEIPPQFASSAVFAQELLAEAGVSVSPGSAFGEYGEGYVRISLVQPAELLTEALERWERWLLRKALRLESE
ncbi:MAG: aminotransferase class I/II-fold pyridoxal phosphate-dependent enzyme [Chloroflexota bacterium]|nr:aminotransferase class I/II-fold pyridoxal phosphate-dependent enzyme [Chloroflexota bacterium]